MDLPICTEIQRKIRFHLNRKSQSKPRKGKKKLKIAWTVLLDYESYAQQANKLNCFFFFFFGINHELTPAADNFNHSNEMHFTVIILDFDSIIFFFFHLILSSIEQFPFQWFKHCMKIVCMPTIPNTHTITRVQALVVARPVKAHFWFVLVSRLFVCFVS